MSKKGTTAGRDVVETKRKTAAAARRSLLERATFTGSARLARSKQGLRERICVGSLGRKRRLTDWELSHQCGKRFGFAFGRLDLSKQPLAPAFIKDGTQDEQYGIDDAPGDIASDRRHDQLVHVQPFFGEDEPASRS